MARILLDTTPKIPENCPFFETKIDFGIVPICGIKSGEERRCTCYISKNIFNFNHCPFCISINNK